ncbi:type II toxin-antitoxin system Rv0910 family toxin [Qaidamihabitans albus]|uniref:type II toxin-antitoxin system Rv0910 family toxin n=1 Tax=Qaidamihabitans albus TaxID=2795733 RepID=UPI0018F19360|nr:SRPBCC family protein [Qaidamihabitans albus]
MGQVAARIEVPAAPEKVWGELVNPAGWPNWFTIHTKWKGEVPEHLAQGSQVAEVVTMLGMPNTITWNVEELDAPAKLVISGTGMAGVKSTFVMSVAPTESGSVASIDATFTGSMIVGALGKAVEKDAQKNLDESLGNLRTLVA